MNKVKILYVLTENLGESFDDEENFSGHNTRTKVQESIVEWNEVGDALRSIRETAADYGDGVTDAKVIAVCDSETNEVLPMDDRYWSKDDEDT